MQCPEKPTRRRNIDYTYLRFNYITFTFSEVSTSYRRVNWRTECKDYNVVKLYFTV